MVNIHCRTQGDIYIFSFFKKILGETGTLVRRAVFIDGWQEKKVVTDAAVEFYELTELRSGLKVYLMDNAAAAKRRNGLRHDIFPKSC